VSNAEIAEKGPGIVYARGLGLSRLIGEQHQVFATTFGARRITTMERGSPREGNEPNGSLRRNGNRARVGQMARRDRAGRPVDHERREEP
jgi:hypothetical protein